MGNPVVRMQHELLDAVQSIDEHNLTGLAELGRELGGMVGAMLEAAVVTERERRDGCGWLVVIGVLDDGEELVGPCGSANGPVGDKGLCAVHDDGLTFEERYAPYGPAWQEERAEHGLDW